MADVAVISVISSAVVGILGAASGLYGQRMTLGSEREKRLEARRDDLRSCLDDAAATAIAFLRPFFADPEVTLGTISGELEKLLPELGRHQARIGVRVGTGNAVASQFDEIVGTTWHLADQIRMLPSEMTVDEARASQDHDEAYQKASRMVDDLNDRLNEFFDAAAKLVGVD
jgi:hypothetical protein